MELLPGDILAVHSSTLIGRLIRLVTKSWTNHVAIYLGNGLVFEARPGGATYVPLKEYNQFKVYRLQVSKEKVYKFIQCALAKQNKKYDYGEILGLLILQIFHLNLKAQNSRKTICSELIYEAAEEAGILPPRVPKAKILPRDFESWEVAKQVES